MTSVPPPPGPPEPEGTPAQPGPPSPPQDAQFAPPGAPPYAGQYAPPAQSWDAPAQPWGAPAQQWQQPQPGPQGHYAPPGHPGQYAQPGHPGQGQYAAPGQPGQYPHQGQQGAQGQYAPPGQPWGAPQQWQQPPSGQPGQPGQPPQGPYTPPGQQLPWGPPQPASPGRSKKPALLIAVVSGVVVIGLAVAAFFALSSPDVDALPKDVETATTAHVRALTVGNCLESAPAGSAVGEVTVVPCDDDHAAQVIAGKKLSGDTFPGDAAVIEQTTAVCPGRSIVADAVPETLEFLVWTPSEASWEEGDRQGLCIASSPDIALTSSLVR